MSEATLRSDALGARRERGAALTATTPPSASSTSTHHAGSTRCGTPGPDTYVHGDTHIGNVYLDGRPRRLPRLGPLPRAARTSRDVSYFLTMTVDPEDRRRTERDLHPGLPGRAARGTAASTSRSTTRGKRTACTRAYTVVATFLAYMPSYRPATASGSARRCSPAPTRRSPTSTWSTRSAPHSPRPREEEHR